MTVGEVTVRPRHVLSALASGAVAGFWANAAIALCLMVVLGLAGSPIPPIDIAPWPAVLGSAVGAVLGGLFYVNMIGWLPPSPLMRSGTFAVPGAPVVAGVLASAYGVPEMTVPNVPIGWIVASAIGTALLTPISLRVVLFLVVRSTASMAALPITASLFLVLLVLVGPLRDPATVASIVSVAPLGMVVLLFVVVVLGIATWTIGVRPLDRRPRWFGPFGWVMAGLAAVTGVGMVAAAVA